MIVRDICWPKDKEQLFNFEATFSTECIYRVTLKGLLVEISEEKLVVPFHKTYPMADVESEINDASFTVAVETSGVITGFATARYEGWNRRVNLTGIYVSPESKGKGIGTALMDAVWEYTQSTSARCLWLETQNTNFPAIRFYLKHKFHFCGFDTALYDHTETNLDEVAFYFCRFR